MRKLKRALKGALCAGAMALGTAVPALATAPEPDYVVTPTGKGAPVLEGPCGAGVDSSGKFYIANYYRHSVDIYHPVPIKEIGFATAALVQNIDPLDGPCGLGVQSDGDVLVNNYHRNVERFVPSIFPVTFATAYASGGIVDTEHPTGVAVDPLDDHVYVNARTYVAAYNASGAPVLDGGNPLEIGAGSLGDGYGLAVSRFPATAGRIYVPDHATDTVKVYDPLVDKDDPVQTIAGPPGGFGSLRDSAVAVDNVSGEVYVADTLAYPQYTERPEAAILVFDAAGTYKGRLKYGVIDGSPPGLAVDNSAFVEPDEPKMPTQGRVYVTSGNTISASVYIYPKGSATSESAAATFSLQMRSDGSGTGSVVSAAGIECDSTCKADIPALAEVTLGAVPDPGSAFTGWTGGGCSGTGPCTVTMDRARSVRAGFEDRAGPMGPSVAGPDNSASSSSAPIATTSVITQKGTLRVTVDGKLAPRRLPREGVAPISVSVGGEISTTDESLPPQLKSMRIELNRGGKLDTRGLPPCDFDAIQPGSSQRALSACRESLVGEGFFTANITLAGQEPYPTSGKLLVFHSIEKGKPVLYGHIYSDKPFATSFVIVFSVQKLGKGTYGTALDAPLPAAMEAWGRLTGLRMTLQRRYSHGGKTHSFISAGCPAPKGFTAAQFPLARTEFSFDGGKKLRSTLMSQCKVRG